MKLRLRLLDRLLAPVTTSPTSSAVVQPVSTEPKVTGAYGFDYNGTYYLFYNSQGSQPSGLGKAITKELRSYHLNRSQGDDLLSMLRKWNERLFRYTPMRPHGEVNPSPSVNFFWIKFGSF